MTLILKLYLDTRKMCNHIKYEGSRLRYSKALAYRQTHRHKDNTQTLPRRTHGPGGNKTKRDLSDELHHLYTTLYAIIYLYTICILPPSYASANNYGHLCKTASFHMKWTLISIFRTAAAQLSFCNLHPVNATPGLF